MKHVKSISLDKEYAYENLVNSDHHAVWFEHYTHSFYVLELKNFEIKQIKIEKGRGPGEAILIRSGIVLDNHLIVYDLGSMKLLFYDLKTGAYQKEQPTNMMLQSIMTDGDQLYGSGLSPNGFFFKFDSDTNQFNPLPNSNLPFLNRFNMADPSFNPFKIQGSYSTCDGCIIFSNYYEPNLYIYRMGSQSLSQFKFEKIPAVDYESGRVGNTFGAPRPLKMRIMKIFRIGSQSFGVLAQGKSDERDYSSKNVHVFNIETQTHESEIQFPFELKDISISDKYIITLSQENWSIDIYEYKIIN